MQASQKIELRDENYPVLLKEIHHPPEALFYRGNIDLLKKSCLSIVGTRKFSDYGEYVTEKIVSELAIADIVIVSGLAKGIDTIAHKSALNNNLPTIAVLGTGIDNIYPEENTNLAKEIVDNNGLMISEYFFQEPRKELFPKRNRIISGISLGTLVIEAPEKSGALITANFALEHNREVFVVPADIDRANSLGNLNLLYAGSAHPVSCGRDIINILNNTSQKVLLKDNPNSKTIRQPLPLKIEYKFDEAEKKVFETMPLKRPTTLEKISQKTGLSSEKILAAFSTLEIYGFLIIRDGKYYRCC